MSDEKSVIEVVRGGPRRTNAPAGSPASRAPDLLAPKEYFRVSCWKDGKAVLSMIAVKIDTSQKDTVMLVDGDGRTSFVYGAGVCVTAEPAR